MAIDKDATKKYSEKQEKLVAMVLEGKVVTASGARPFDPGDVKNYDWLAECKTHTDPGKSIFFDLKVWNKICDEAMAMHRNPVLIVDDGSQKEENTWCLCRSINIDKSQLLILDLPVQIRKNITIKNDKLKEAIKPLKEYIGVIYKGACFDVNWNNEELSIVPLSIFKEVLDK